MRRLLLLLPLLAGCADKPAAVKRERVTVTVKDHGGPYDQGKAAYAAGVRPEANPHIAAAPQGDDPERWLAGWIDAKNEAEKGKGK